MVDVILKWIEYHPGTATWVQAIFSIIAILIAIAVPAWQERQRQRGEAEVQFRRAKGLALLLNTEVHTVQRALEWAIHKPDLITIEIEIPQPLTDHISDLWHMGPAGDRILHLIAILRAHNRFTSDNRRLEAKNKAGLDIMSELNELARKRMETALRDCISALDKIRTLLEASRP